ncbi:hypothetical protein BDZ45DRAFT_196844 [Acephala macrosclerotiorum]|nr:hypothetical protein BDZ45DRAFT_196844 [Acephala macrosclerotiorum]
MPIHELTRRDSWPPTQVHLQSSPSHPSHPSHDIEDIIDANPFAFFLTSPEELDIDDYLSDEDLSAGIETPESKSPVREVSPSALQRNPLPEDVDDEEDYEFGFGLAIPLSLKDFTNNTNSGRKSRTGNRSKEEELHGLGINLGDFPSRGRAKVRLVPARSGRGRGLRQSRSLSARRPQSWTAPSPEIFSIREERESDEEKNGNPGLSMKVDEDIYSASAPASTQIGGIMASPKTKPKEKKRVHWAL